MKKRAGSTVILPLALLLAAAGAVVYGLTRGEMLTVLQKATAVCLECIGIG